MKRHRSQLLVAAAIAIILSQGPTFGARWSIEDPSNFPGVWYRIVFDTNGDVTTSDGDGQGWYYYPESDTYRMWFHNGDFDTSRKARLYYHVYVEAVDTARSTYASIRFIWTSAQWSQSGHSSPPYPEDVPTLADEDEAISSSGLLTIDNWMLREGSSETEKPCTIDDYNPEWTGIEISGRNAYIFRGAYHECLAKTETLLGACCNRSTGFCYTTLEENCEAPFTWLGAGSSCADCRASTGSSVDFGDAPDPAYPTLLASDGARHTISAGLFLGRSVDGEADGQPNLTATGDDATGADDDGVVFTSALQRDMDAAIEVTASARGYLNAWIDFNADGSFAGPGEQIFFDTLLTEGVNHLAFRVPADAVSGPTFARFRFNSRGVLSYDGPATDGEVEDYRVDIVQQYEPYPASGETALIWSQLPLAVSTVEPYTFEAGHMPSAMHLQQIAADDWLLPDDRPVTGVHWWCTFESWTEPFLPGDLPLGFHIGIWTNMPDPEPYNFETFPHPDTLIWESYCTSWTWVLAGYEKDDQGKLGETCFQFTHLLSQEQWFHPTPPPPNSGEPAVYWLSITAVYDTNEGKPGRMCAWKTRTEATNAAATLIQELVPPTPGASWPPVIGSQWSSGTLMRDGDFQPIDMAFQLTTYAPLEPPAPAPPKAKIDPAKE